jgi:hypothetical protein
VAVAVAVAERMTATLMMPVLAAAVVAVAEHVQPWAALVVVQVRSQSACACKTHRPR